MSCNLNIQAYNMDLLDANYLTFSKITMSRSWHKSLPDSLCYDNHYIVYSNLGLPPVKVLHPRPPRELRKDNPPHDSGYFFYFLMLEWCKYVLRVSLHPPPNIFLYPPNFKFLEITLPTSLLVHQLDERKPVGPRCKDVTLALHRLTHDVHGAQHDCFRGAKIKHIDRTVLVRPLCIQPR